MFGVKLINGQNPKQIRVSILFSEEFKIETNILKTISMNLLSLQTKDEDVFF